MRGPHNIIRLIRTGATLERTGAMNVVLDAFDAPWALRILAKTLAKPFRFLGYKGDPNMPPATSALTALGPAYIKFGRAPFRPLPWPRPRRRAAACLAEPVAAASIAQVHKATLAETGEQVAVKVLRPGVERAFTKDVDAFYFAAWVVDLFAPGARRLRPLDVIEHFDGVVQGELDLRLEASSAAEFAANTKDDKGFALPDIKWMYSGRRVMTLGWADGTALGDNEALDAAGHDRRELGVRVLQLFLNHALRDGFFHGDMHQGNLKVAPNGDIIAYDFGIMGHIDEYTRRVYAEILFGFIRKDYKRVAEVHFEAGYVPAGKDVDEFARALRAVGEPIFGMDATKISMGRLLAYLFEVTERFGMETRTELILLQRTMVVVEGVARSLNPNINIWEVASPIVTDYISKSIGPRAALRDLAKTAQVLARFGPRLPVMVEAALIRQSNPEPPKRRGFWRWITLAALIGAAAMAGAIGLADLFD